MTEDAPTMTRFEVRDFTSAALDDAAGLLAERHRRHRLAVPALDPRFEDPAETRPVIAELAAREDAIGAIAYDGATAAGYVLFTPRSNEQWGPNTWAEDGGTAGAGEAVKNAYAKVAGRLVDAGIRAHWAMVPPSDTDLVDAWFGISFGLQHAYAVREPVGADFQPQAPEGLLIRRPTPADVPALAALDLVLPHHLIGAPVFSKLNPPSVEEAAAELADDINDPKYSFWVAEHDGRVISTLVGTSIHETKSWGPLMKPVSAGFLGFAATLPDARGLGAGRALTDVFMAWARDEGYEWLVTDWRTTNLEANRTWRAMGFQPHFLRLFRAIP